MLMAGPERLKMKLKALLRDKGQIRNHPNMWYS